ncbi:MAG: phage tail sheath family protein [Fluviicola sp.]
MATFKTPGVYVQEITKFPPSVAPVATAIPAFIGYTEKATELQTGDLNMIPKRITSMVDYERYFGLADKETDINVEVNSAGSIIVSNNSPSNYKMYYALQMYFANGGGPCYIASVGTYSDPIELGNDTSGLLGGLAAIRKQDEPTLLLTPDDQGLSSSDFNQINQSKLTQCAELQDRFAIVDTYGDSPTAIDNFRTGIGNDNLKYGASYYPFLNTILDYRYDDSSVDVDDATTESSEEAVDSLVAKLDTTNLESKIADLVTKRDEIDAFTGATEDADSVAEIPALQSIVNSINTELMSLSGILEEIVAIGKFESANTEADAITSWISNLKSTVIDALDSKMDEISGQTTKVTIFNRVSENAGSLYDILGGTPGDVASAFGIITTDFPNLLSTEVAALQSAIDAPGSNTTTLDVLEANNNDLYNRIKAAIADFPVKLAPSSAMAGIYARVDNAVGVWKAPANVTVQFVQEPTVRISNEEQEDMNVTSSGKSVNAIRTFVGKGTLVWGARTLAGNDNEWRYVPVRRLFNFVEESVSEATEQFVFEPNTSSTWVRIRTLIENFLTDLWKAGGLAGGTPEQAFYVRVGLGQTMTSQDILEGRMIVEIGMAATRPAEFIVLRFSHKMQEA